MSSLELRPLLTASLISVIEYSGAHLLTKIVRYARGAIFIFLSINPMGPKLTLVVDHTSLAGVAEVLELNTLYKFSVLMDDDTE